MKRKSLGVPKWSQPRSGHEPGVRQRLQQRVGRPDEILVSEDHQHREVDPGQIGGVERSGSAGACRRPGPPGRFRAPERRWRRPGPRRGRPPAVSPTSMARAAASGSPPPRNRLAPTPPTTSRPKPTRIGRGNPQEQVGAHRKTDGVDRSRRRQGLDDVLLEMSVGGGIVGFLGFAVPEQVHPDDLVALLLQEVDPAGLTPVALERRGEAMDQQDGEIGHRGRVRPGATNRSTGSRRTPVA